MRNLFPIIFSIVIIVLFGVFQLLFLKLFNRQWWTKRWIRTFSWILPFAGILMVILWGYGEYYAVSWLALSGALLAILTLILEVGLFISLPFSGVIHLFQWLIDRLLSHNIKKHHSVSFDQNRRLFLKTTAAAIPIITLATGTAGVVKAMSGVNVFKKTIYFDNLPSDLDGLKILHLSDMHLSHYLVLEDLVDVLAQAEHFSPDLTLITGDIADDLRLLPNALKLIEQLNHPYGTYASLGNHEYFRGIAEVHRYFDKSTIPLLVNDFVRVKINNTPLFIGGLDDPRLMGAKDYKFFRKAVNTTLTNKNHDDFVVLMSHRPDALDYASEKEVALTLAGHTHGGQVGFGNRSLFESMWPNRYLWGHYQKKQSHLYTSSGVGHWFP
ncbi:MAG: metallophosphoesterase, partial [Candidatus Zixiibacteriota bacterium]